MLERLLDVPENKGQTFITEAGENGLDSTLHTPLYSDTGISVYRTSRLLLLIDVADDKRCSPSPDGGLSTPFVQV